MEDQHNLPANGPANSTPAEGSGQVVIATVGLPGSGKTTWANKMVASGGFVRVNSDELREQHPRSHEARIRHLRDEGIVRALQSGKSVIVDNTNLRGVSDLRRIAREFGADFRVQDFRDVPWQECVRRDAARIENGERATERSVIIRMAMDARLFKLDPSINKEAVIIDLDGTLTDTSDRIHHLRGEKPDWKAFFEGMGEDRVNRAVAALYKMARGAGYTIIFVSGRPENYRIVTEKWLREHGFDAYFALFMRGTQDQRPDTEVKANIYDRYVAPYFEVVFTVDDRPKVVKMWRDKGLTCFAMESDEE